MSTTAMIVICMFSFLVGFVAGYLAGRGEDHDDRRGHPHDYE